MTTPRLTDMLSIAEEAIRQAGGFLKTARGASLAVTADVDRDIKLAVDKGSEDIILKALRKHSGLPILAEEQGTVMGQDTAAGLYWIVDPLDGSLNFFRGIPICCVSIGLMQGTEPLLGAVYDFNREEFFSGIVGEGAWLNGVPVRVSSTVELRKAVLCTGFPVATDFSTEALLHFVQQVRHYKKVRLLGSAALSLAYVAAGRADCYYERDIKVWDVAGGLALVKAAGGKIVQSASSSPYVVSVYAGGPDLMEPDFG